MSQKLITLIQGALADAGGSQRLVTVDRKTIDKSWKMMDKVVKLCQHPRMNIKNSPPFILDILPDTFQQLKLVVTNYEDRMSQLSSNEYFVCFMDNLINKLKKCIRVCTRSLEILAVWWAWQSTIKMRVKTYPCQLPAWHSLLPTRQH